MEKEFKLRPIDWAFYHILEDNLLDFDNVNSWVTKDEIFTQLNFQGFSLEWNNSSHDVCSTLNQIRLRLNYARHLGLISHVVLLYDNKFKLAESPEEVLEYCKRDYDNGVKLLVRYYQNIGAIKEDGQGKLIDCKGNVITEESLAKRFNEVFSFEKGA